MNPIMRLTFTGNISTTSLMAVAVPESGNTSLTSGLTKRMIATTKAKLTDTDRPLQEATEIVQQHGCLICGEQPAFQFYNGDAKMSLSPCGHSVWLADAWRLEQLHDEIGARD